MRHPVRGGFDGPIPHRRKLPWVASASLRETFEPLGVEPDDEGSELSEKEVAVQNRLAPVRDLVSSLVASREVETLVEDLAAAELDLATEQSRLDEAASTFVKRRGSRTWRTMREVLRRVVEARRYGKSYPRAVLRLADSAVDVHAPLEADDPQQRGLALRNREAAAMLVARATGHCSHVSSRLTPGGELEVALCNARVSAYSDSKLYCHLHLEQRTPREDRQDREAVTTLLRGVADALRVPA